MTKQEVICQFVSRIAIPRFGGGETYWRGSAEGKRLRFELEDLAISISDIKLVPKTAPGAVVSETRRHCYEGSVEVKVNGKIIAQHHTVFGDPLSREKLTPRLHVGQEGYVERLLVELDRGLASLFGLDY